MKQLTLCYLVREDAICLGMKKRGFGAGNWNGFGGKCEGDETLRAAAARELQEESLVTVREVDLEQVAELDFHFVNGDHLNVHAYFAKRWSGEPEETEEMRPAWFLFSEIPYEKMWADDIHWMPRVFAGEKLRGTVWFDERGVDIKKMEWEPVSGF